MLIVAVLGIVVLEYQINKETFMKNTKLLISIILLWVIFSLFDLLTFAYAGEKEELQWKARALSAEATLHNNRLVETQRAIQDFMKELDAKGYMVTQDGTVTEKPKPAPPVDKSIPQPTK